MATTIERRLFTVDDYHRMGESGILTEDDRVELIAGEIVQMSPIGSEHAGIVKRLNRVLTVGAGSQALVGVQDPVTFPPYSEPQPDLALLRPRDDDYTSGHPTPADVLLLIEVADSSLAFDRAVKLPLYAREGVREVWLVDLRAQRIERHAEPRDGTYQLVSQAGRGETLSPTALPQLTVSVDDILK